MGIGYVDPLRGPLPVTTNGAKTMTRVDVDAWGEGHEAYERGIANPYNSGTVKAIEWNCGFQVCEAKAAERGETTNRVETMSKTTTDVTHPAKTVTIPASEYHELTFNAAQCARLRKDVATLTERLDDEGIEAPPGPDLVTLHATLAVKMRCYARTRDETITRAGKVAGIAIRKALIFAESVAAGNHDGDANEMVESELSSDETLKRMKGGVARGGETGA